jgi:hypothetical protein
MRWLAGQLLCRFSDAGNHDANPALKRPASEKRQGTKSRRRVVRRQRRGLYWDLSTGRDMKARRLATAIRLEWEHNLNVPARILLNGDFTFCPIRDFNELSLAKEHTRQLLRDELHDKLWTAA